MREMLHRHSTLFGLSATLILILLVGEVSHWSTILMIVTGLVGIWRLPRLCYGVLAAHMLDKEDSRRWRREHSRDMTTRSYHRLQSGPDAGCADKLYSTSSSPSRSLSNWPRAYSPTRLVGHPVGQCTERPYRYGGYNGDDHRENTFVYSDFLSFGEKRGFVRGLPYKEDVGVFERVIAHYSLALTQKTSDGNLKTPISNVLVCDLRQPTGIHNEADWLRHLD
jgi:hypothetical protein